jgi:hypothetical protein
VKFYSEVAEFFAVESEPARISLILAFSVHLFTFLAVIFLPGIIDRKPVMPEIYTVDLFNIEEIKQQPLQELESESDQRPRVKKDSKTAIPIGEQVVKTVKRTGPAPVLSPRKVKKAISLKPSRVKKKKSKEFQKEQIEKLRLKRAMDKAKIRAARMEAEQKAELAAKEALDHIRNKILAKQKAKTRAAEKEKRKQQNRNRANYTKTENNKGRKTSGAHGTIQITNLAKKQYFATVRQQLRSNWTLPEMQKWADDLEAIIVFKLNSDGIVIDSFFKKKTKNIYFNQFVEKTLQASSPMPPFPPEVDDNELEFEQAFTPREIL